MGDRYRAPRDSRESRERDENPNVEYFGAGESYRPGGHTGSGPFRPQARTTDSYSSDRREPRREERREDRREDIDSYIPPTSSRARPRSRSPGYRRRSRTPPARDRGDLFPGRARSPPRRFSPRRDDRARSPPRRRSRSPYGRGRTPDTKRPRDYSPDPRETKRERVASPDRGYDRARSPARRAYSPAGDARRGGYRSRSRTPPRKTAYQDDNWRPRSPSPRPDSSNPSRRSSPPVHPDRASLAGSGPRSPIYHPRYDSREGSQYASRAQDDYQQNGDSTQPPTGPAASRNGSYDRPPPSGPSRGYSGGTPTGPAAGSMSAHNRGGFPAPARPRGAPAGPRYDGPPRDFTSPPMRGRGSLTYRAPTAPRSTSYQDGPPSGPRAGGFGRGDYGGGRGEYNSSRGEYGGGRGDYGGGRGDFGARGDYGGRGDFGAAPRGGFGRGAPEAAFPFRGSNNSTSTTYPRTQRFNSVQQHLATTEKIVPGGKLLPSGLNPDQEKKLKQLEAEAEKLRLDLAEKQKIKREGVNEWEVRERESEREGLRSELAEDSLHKLQEGEDGGMAAF